MGNWNCGKQNDWQEETTVYYVLEMNLRCKQYTQGILSIVGEFGNSWLFVCVHVGVCINMTYVIKYIQT